MMVGETEREGERERQKQRQRGKERVGSGPCLIGSVNHLKASLETTIRGEGSGEKS